MIDFGFLFIIAILGMFKEKGVYLHLVDVLAKEGNGEGIVVLYGDNRKPHVISKGLNGVVVVSGHGQDNIVSPNGEQIVLNNS